MNLTAAKMAALLAGLVVALAVAAPAAAHPGYSKPNDFYAERMELRITNFRLRHEAAPLISSIATHLATIALSEANFREGRWSTKIGRVPFQVWNEPFFGNEPAAMLKTIRCHGLPFTPMQAFRKLTREGKNPAFYRLVLRSHLWLFGSVRTVYVHKHGGWYKGRGRCTAYYIALAG